MLLSKQNKSKTIDTGIGIISWRSCQLSVIFLDFCPPDDLNKIVGATPLML